MIESGRDYHFFHLGLRVLFETWRLGEFIAALDSFHEHKKLSCVLESSAKLHLCNIGLKWGHRAVSDKLRCRLSFVCAIRELGTKNLMRNENAIFYFDCSLQRKLEASKSLPTFIINSFSKTHFLLPPAVRFCAISLHSFISSNSCRALDG